MRFSVILPVYLGKYANAAKNRDEKFIRAIDSVMNQTFTDFELVIVSDGDSEAVEIAKPFVEAYYPKIKLYKIPKQKIWSGVVRNTGIFKSEGDYIVYQDSDDKWGVDHLKIINDNLNGYDWVWSDYWVWNHKKSEWQVFTCNLDVHGMCGTSSVCHKRSLEVYWNNNSYSHDWVLIQDLKQASSNYAKIPCSEYFVCHNPHNKNGYDV